MTQPLLPRFHYAFGTMPSARINRSCKLAPMQPLEAQQVTLRQRYTYLPKDFVEARQGLLCAVVAEGLEFGRVLVTPRYLRSFDGALRKLDSLEALELVREHYPTWMFHSPSRDVLLPAIPVEELSRLHRPSDGWLTAPDREGSEATVFRQLASTFQTITTDVGLTGSYLIGAAGAESDMDLVVYGLKNFATAQRLVATAIGQGEQQENQQALPLQALTHAQWQTSYQRRGCSLLTFAEYLWHEQRKSNKFSVAGIKIDVSCVDETPPAAQHMGRKQGVAIIRGRVTDATYAFASPAMFAIDHPTIQRILVFTATYVGQARVGEMIEAQGQVEAEPSGALRLIVGSSREAPNEYLRVAHTCEDTRALGS